MSVLHFQEYLAFFTFWGNRSTKSLVVVLPQSSHSFPSLHKMGFFQILDKYPNHSDLLCLEPSQEGLF